MTKIIQVKTGRTVEQDDAGKWTLVESEFGIREPVKQAEVIDILKRAGKRDLILQHFPMHGFSS